MVHLNVKHRHLLLGLAAHCRQSFFTGWLAGILGIGGGLIRMPSLIYLVGCPTHVAVGTDLFEVMPSPVSMVRPPSPTRGASSWWPRSSC